METMYPLARVLPWADWAALAWFFLAWVGYARFAQRRAGSQPSLLATMHRVRREWMLQSTYRDLRTLDGVVLQNLATSPSFFASTTILIIGGLLAVLGTTDKATDLVREIPFVATTTALVFDLKLVLLLAIFIYAFFRFTWSMRQYTFGAQMVAAVPEAKQIEALGDGAQAVRESHGERAARMIGLAAETFNDGLRSYYMSFAAMGWFFSPVIFVIATAAVIAILYRREFYSDALDVLREG